LEYEENEQSKNIENKDGMMNANIAELPKLLCNTHRGTLLSERR